MIPEAVIEYTAMCIAPRTSLQAINIFRSRYRRGLITWRYEAGEPSRSKEAFHPAVHPVAGARVPMSRCELPVTVLPEDEEGRHAYKDLQAKDERRLSNLQTAYCVMLLSRETLSGEN